MIRRECFGKAGRKRAPRSTILCWTALLLASTATVNAARIEPPGNYTISVTPRLLGGGKIELDIDTNIPGTIEVTADVSLAGQKDDDLVIGTDGQDVTLHNGHGKTVIDLVQAVSGTPLPAGTYDAEAAFYPNWGFKDARSRKSGIDHQIHGGQRVVLGGAQKAQDVERRMKHADAVMDWILDHGKFGDRWAPKIWIRRFGPYVTLTEPFLDRDPRRVKQIYFPDVDWTVVVNVHENIILTVDRGKGAKPGRLGGEE